MDASPPATLNETIVWLEGTVLFDTENCPFRFSSFRAEPTSRVLLIAGANATGKSLLFRHVAAAADEKGLSVITISIRERTGSGSFEMAAFRRSMMFGDEHEQSTGATSYRVVKTGFRNIHSRLEKEDGQPTLLLLDEPEMGLSTGYAAAMGEYLAKEASALPARAPGLVVVTHSRDLVRQMLEHLPARPHFLYTGLSPLDLDTWISAPEHRTVEDLEKLEALGMEGRQAFSAFVRKLEGAKKAPSPPKESSEVVPEPSDKAKKSVRSPRR